MALRRFDHRHCQTSVHTESIPKRQPVRRAGHAQAASHWPSSLHDLQLSFRATYKLPYCMVSCSHYSHLVCSSRTHRICITRNLDRAHHVGCRRREGEEEETRAPEGCRVAFGESFQQPDISRRFYSNAARLVGLPCPGWRDIYTFSAA